MSPKNRPTPLSDESFFGPSVSLPVKNTFIDVPSASTPVKQANGGMTAPPVLDGGGFLSSQFRQSLNWRPLGSPAPSTINSFVKMETPQKGGGLSFTPLQTPSPAGFRPHFWPQFRFPSLPTVQLLHGLPTAEAMQPIDFDEETVSSDYEETEDEVDQSNLPMPSRGSVGHFQGSCKRCCFFPRGRCMNGYDCEFCHFNHEKRKRKNKKKKSLRASTERFRGLSLWPQMTPCPAPPPAPPPKSMRDFPRFAAPMFQPPQYIDVYPTSLEQNPPPPNSPDKSLIKRSENVWEKEE